MSRKIRTLWINTNVSEFINSLGLTKYILTCRNPEDKKSKPEEFPGLIHTRNKDFDEYLAGVVDKMVRILLIKFRQERSSLKLTLPIEFAFYSRTW